MLFPISLLGTRAPPLNSSKAICPHPRPPRPQAAEFRNLSCSVFPVAVSALLGQAPLCFRLFTVTTPAGHCHSHAVTFQLSSARHLALRDQPHSFGAIQCKLFLGFYQATPQSDQMPGATTTEPPVLTSWCGTLHTPSKSYN